MKVKATEIAKAMGISKATVSLALNGKGGVSEKTRQRILEYRDLMERGELPETFSSPGQDAKKSSDETLLNNGTVLVFKAVKGLNIASNAELDLWTDVLWVLERELRDLGYLTNVFYLNVLTDPVEEILRNCLNENVRGIILTATELSLEDLELFEKLDIPMIIYDNESFHSLHHSILADNYRGVEYAIEYLLGQGCRDILYLANEKDIYNFRERRKAFCDTMARHQIDAYAQGRIVPIGTTVNDVYQKSREYLESHHLPEAFLMENYQVSIGMTRALMERGIEIPGQISLIGIDVVPEYMTGNFKLTAVRVPHTERAVAAVVMLEKEIRRKSDVKSRILTYCDFIEGESTKK